MIPFEYVDIIQSSVVLFSAIVGFMRYKLLSMPEKIILGLILLSLIVERIATYCIITIRNSNVVYGAFSPIEILIISLYFHYSVDAFRNNRTAIFIGLGAFLFGYINYFFVQSPFKMNNFFLLLQSLLIITLSMYSFYRMLIVDESLILTRYSHFWITSILLFFWTATFFIWGLYDYMTITLSVGNGLINDMLLYVNVITYVGFGLVFLFHNKMQPKDGR
jgi:hypothetical protein